jgi:hypothetical protein
MAAPSLHVDLLMAEISLQRCWRLAPFYLGGSATFNESIDMLRALQTPYAAALPD